MIATKSVKRKTSSRRDSDDRSQRAAQLVADLLRTLLERLETPRSDGESTRPVSLRSDGWEDEAYTYLGFRLPGDLDADIDLNLHENRVLIRVAHLGLPD